MVFAGTPEFAVPTLRALIDRYQIIGVYTQPDRPAGRGRKLKASPVKALALAQDILVFQPASLKSPEVQRELADLNPDVMVVAAYGLILPQAVLDIPKYGCLNVHGSLLPRWRGAAPVQRAILAGDGESGVTIMQMDAGLDTGPMLAKDVLRIGENETAGELGQRIAQSGAKSMLHVLDDLLQDRLKPEIQDDSLATYASKIQKPEAQLDFTQDSVTLHNQVRAFNPVPVAFTFLGQERVRIWETRLTDESNDNRERGSLFVLDQRLMVSVGDGALEIVTLQLAGGKPLSAQQFLHAREVTGSTLGGS